jgi:N-acetylglucosaminyldiphosphoundecaprenol N-acetyl-beta-D-mannosaminyltransferase
MVDVLAKTRTASRPHTKPGEREAMRRLLIILGVPIDDLTMEEALARIDLFVRQGRATGRSHQIATVNADFVVKALQDPELRRLLQEADMATADGMPLVWGARLLGAPLPERVAGADMAPALAQRAAEKGYALYLLGAAPGVAARAAAALQARHPALRIVGVQSPPYSSVLEMDAAILDDIRAARPDILLVAFGNPKQEKWIGMHGRNLGVPVLIGVGGALDFIAGETRRAPLWMQNVGLEWLHRLLQNPRRLWRRYVIDLAVFSAFFVRQWWLMRRGRQIPLLLPKTEAVIVEETAVLSVHGRLDFANCADFVAQAQQALRATPFLLVNLATATFLDSSAIGALVGLANAARNAEGKLWLVNVPQPIHQALALLRLDQFFEILNDVETGLATRKRQAQQPNAELRRYGAWTIVQMPRRLDASTAPQVQAACLETLAANPRLVLDFSETVFLASAGLAVIAALQRQAAASQGELRLANCARDVRRVLEMVRFDRIIGIYADLNTATAAPITTAIT